uniref:Relaxin 3 n=1 Tax=Naja naja TaxID=35670 RepID=A0A8C6YHT2_NAJNA
MLLCLTTYTLQNPPSQFPRHRNVAAWKLLFLLVLVLGVLLSEKWLVTEARTPHYGVKLCGREFIRAVIFTCGGSRWRRAGEQRGCWFIFIGVFPRTLPGYLLGMYDYLFWFALELSPRWFSYALSEEPWSLDRGARDVMESLSNACCKWGCSKREISSLC